jgi:hypothetical protein
VPKLCECNPESAGKALSALSQLLASSQWHAKTGDAPTSIPEACALLKSLLPTLESDPYRQARETCLLGLVKLAKDARRTALERREAQNAAVQMYANQQQQAYTDRREGYRAAVVLLVSLVDLFVEIAFESDVYRQLLKVGFPS